MLCTALAAAHSPRKRPAAAAAAPSIVTWRDHRRPAANRVLRVLCSISRHTSLSTGRRANAQQAAMLMESDEEDWEAVDLLVANRQQAQRASQPAVPPVGPLRLVANCPRTVNPTAHHVAAKDKPQLPEPLCRHGRPMASCARRAEHLAEIKESLLSIMTRLLDEPLMPPEDHARLMAERRRLQAEQALLEAAPPLAVHGSAARRRGSRGAVAAGDARARPFSGWCTVSSAAEAEPQPDQPACCTALRGTPGRRCIWSGWLQRHRRVVRASRWSAWKLPELRRARSLGKRLPSQAGINGSGQDSRASARDLPQLRRGGALGSVMPSARRRSGAGPRQRRRRVCSWRISIQHRQL